MPDVQPRRLLYAVERYCGMLLWRRRHRFRVSASLRVQERQLDHDPAYLSGRASGCAAPKRPLDGRANMGRAASMLGHKNAPATPIYTGPDEAAAVAAVEALAVRVAGVSVDALAACEHGLDHPQTPGYSSWSPREGGGIGRRTSLRC